MRKWIILLVLLAFLPVCVSATDFTAPAVPDSAKPYMPQGEESFAEGLLYILKSAIKRFLPELANAAGTCLSLIATVLFISIISNFSKSTESAIRLTGAVVIGLTLLSQVDSIIRLGASTVTELSEYGKLLLPVMTASVAAQGGVTSSAALYTGTVFFNTILTSAITRLLIPGIYIFLCLCIAGCALHQEMLSKLKGLLKWVITWCLKWVLYIFTGYISITGVISGSVDASAVKAAKLTITGVVPVVGGILSDASETILVSAGLMKNAAGMYGIFALLSICVGPFLQTGILYLLLKAAGIVCGAFGYKPAVSLIEDFSTGMGFVLAMTGTVCILLLISLVCYMRVLT